MNLCDLVDKCKSTGASKTLSSEEVNPVAVRFVPRSAKKNLSNVSTIKNVSRNHGGPRIPLNVNNVTVIEEKPLVMKPEDSITFNVDDPYDPIHPTDYYEYLEIKRGSLYRPIVSSTNRVVDHSGGSSDCHSGPDSLPNKEDKLSRLELNTKTVIANGGRDGAISLDSVSQVIGDHSMANKPTKPSKVIVLCNMVGRGEVDSELAVEVSTECQSYGVVNQCIAHEMNDINVPDEQAVRIFVFFDTTEASEKAIATLNNRYFAGRQIKVSRYPESAFFNKNYELSL